MTKSWQKRHWFFLIVGICLVILILWPTSGASEGVRIIWHGLLDLILKVGQEIIILLNQVIDKI